MPKVKEKSYRSQMYKSEWEKEQWASGWLKRGKTPDKAYCTVCDKQLVCGKSELVKHSEVNAHVAASKQVASSRSLSTLFVDTAGRSTRVCAELNSVALVARKNIALNFLDAYMETLRFISSDSQHLKSMSCNRTKGTYLLTECLSVRAHDDLVSDLKKSSGFSVLCDKATDITMTKIFCVTVRYANSETFDIESKLYRLIPVEAGDASSLFTSLESCFKEDGIPWTKVIGYASDGENLMQGGNNSFLTRMQEAVPNIFVLKCYCHSFHLVASHACESLSRTAEQLVHDIYNYFKMSPNRQKSYAEFQHFTECEPHKILRPCQTRWLSLSHCVNRILEQWPALELYFTAEVAEPKAPQAAGTILANLKGPYVKATLEFTSCALGDLVGLNTLFQAEDFFQLHKLLPEIQRVIRSFCNNFMKHHEIPSSEKLQDLDVDDEMKWRKVDDVYPGICAYETLKQMKPHERESFLIRCRNFYREAIKQMLQRVDVGDIVLQSLQDVNHLRILKGEASQSTAGVLFKALNIGGQIKENGAIQQIDSQWRSLLIDENVLCGHWESKSIMEFWRAMIHVEAYSSLAKFFLQVLEPSPRVQLVLREFFQR